MKALSLNDSKVQQLIVDPESDTDQSQITTSNHFV